MRARAPKIVAGELLPGTKYTVKRLIGAGGMGVVYEVTKPPSITGVVKLMGLDIAEDAVLQRRFLDEVRILSQLDHPNIVRVL
jgi:eukaryotic-like serine/threonine-protein kinase